MKANMNNNSIFFMMLDLNKAFTEVAYERKRVRIETDTFMSSIPTVNSSLEMPVKLLHVDNHNQQINQFTPLTNAGCLSK